MNDNSKNGDRQRRIQPGVPDENNPNPPPTIRLNNLPTNASARYEALQEIFYWALKEILSTTGSNESLYHDFKLIALKSDTPSAISQAQILKIIASYAVNLLTVDYYYLAPSDRAKYKSSKKQTDKFLVGLTKQLIKHLNYDPERVRWLAERTDQWPALIGPHLDKDKDDEILALQQKLQIGQEMPIQFTQKKGRAGTERGKRPSRESDANRRLLHHFEEVYAYWKSAIKSHPRPVQNEHHDKQLSWQKSCAILPPLYHAGANDTTVEKWLHVIREKIETDYMGPDGKPHPEIPPRILNVLYHVHDCLAIKEPNPARRTYFYNSFSRYMTHHPYMQMPGPPTEKIEIGARDPETGNVDTLDEALQNLPWEFAVKVWLPELPDHRDEHGNALSFRKWEEIMRPVVFKWLQVVALKGDAPDPLFYHTQMVKCERLPDLRPLGVAERESYVRQSKGSSLSDFARYDESEERIVRGIYSSLRKAMVRRVRKTKPPENQQNGTGPHLAN